MLAALSQPHEGEFCLLLARPLLSLYGGVGHCCISVAEFGGGAFLVALAKHKDNDLGRPRVAQEIEKVVADFDCLGIDICGNTWSRARRAPVWSSMPSALRSNSLLTGLPELNDRDSNTVRLHNYMCRRVMKYAEISIRAGKSGWIENPRTSMLWKRWGPEVETVWSCLCRRACLSVWLPL